MDKTVASAQEAVADIVARSTIAVGGFGLCGIPSVLLEALLRSEADDLEVFSNNAGVEDAGVGLLLTAGRLRRIVASYVGENREFARQFLSGELGVLASIIFGCPSNFAMPFAANTSATRPDSATAATHMI